VAFFQLASGTLLSLVYNCWAGGFPWYLADAYYVGDFTGHLDYFQILSWLSVVALVWSSCSESGWIPKPPRTPRLRLRFAQPLLATSLLFYPMAKELRNDARIYPLWRTALRLFTFTRGKAYCFPNGSATVWQTQKMTSISRRNRMTFGACAA